MSPKKESPLAPSHYSAFSYSQQPPEKQYRELKSQIENSSQDSALVRVMKEVLESEIFKDGWWENKPLNNFDHLFREVCRIILVSNIRNTKAKIATDFAPILNTFKAFTPLCSWLGIKERKIQEIFSSLEKLRDDTLKKLEKRIEVDPVDELIILFQNSQSNLSIVAKIRCIHRLLHIPSLIGFIITTDAIKKRYYKCVK